MRRSSPADALQPNIRTNQLGSYRNPGGTRRTILAALACTNGPTDSNTTSPRPRHSPKSGLPPLVAVEILSFRQPGCRADDPPGPRLCAPALRPVCLYRGSEAQASLFRGVGRQDKDAILCCRQIRTPVSEASPTVRSCLCMKPRSALRLVKSKSLAKMRNYRGRRSWSVGLRSWGARKDLEPKTQGVAPEYVDHICRTACLTRPWNQGRIRQSVLQGIVQVILVRRPRPKT
jgi:hypothetical protein